MPGTVRTHATIAFHLKPDHPMKRFVLALLGAISLTACAQSPQPGGAAAAAATGAAKTTAAPIADTADARAIQAVRKLNAQIKVDKVGAAPIPGFREAIVQGQVVYVSDDGRYMFLTGTGGAVFDTQGMKNLSEQAISGMRLDLLKTIPAGDRIRFAPANPVHTVTVFTDVECGYCQKLHGEIAEYNRQGIAVEYLAFPRAGLGSPNYHQMVSVWCAADRRGAMTAAKSGGTVPRKACATSVNQQYDVGQRIGLTGTPMILSERGIQLGGYVPPAQLRKVLDKEKADASGR